MIEPEFTVGQPLPDLVRRIELVDMVAYGAATWDWHRFHYDPEVAAQAGFDRPVVDGQMLGALLAEQASLFIGSAGRLSRLHFKNRAPVLCGSIIVCRGKVSAVADTAIGIVQEIHVEDRVVVTPAGAEFARRRPRA